MLGDGQLREHGTSESKLDQGQPGGRYPSLIDRVRSGDLLGGVGSARLRRLGK